MTSLGSLLAMTRRKSQSSALPVADAAGLAGPDLNPRIERLGVERIAVAMGEFRARCAAPLLGVHARLLVGQMGNPSTLHVEPGLRGRLRTGLRALGLAI